MMRLRLAPTLIVLALTLPALGQNEVIPHAQDRPPGPPKSPAEAVAAMTVPEGFAVEVVASEPDLVNPVAMTIDEKGRFWITESLEYPRRQPGPGRDRVKVLEDTDGDGKADQFTIFADGLNIPSGIAVGHGGVWVANSPDILFYPDADRDAKPDGPPEVVVTGFGRDDTHELPNSLTWGPDGWLYGWNGVFNHSRVTNRKGETFDFTCAIFRIHPKTRDFELFCQGTSNPWGIAINDTGDFFASACVIDHLWHLVESAYYIRQGGPYPPHTWPMGSIVDHKHQKAAYCGIHYFDSPAYPEAYRNRLYMGNIHGNGINVDVLQPNGSTYRAEPAPDFLSANDAWFMPVVQKTGPDGCLYVLDWYDRYHCYQDANRDPAGIDRLKGRLYRVRYQQTPRRTGFDLASESDDALIELLGSPNVYDRETARRLLVERLATRGDLSALETLTLAGDDAPRTKRLGALFTLLSIEAMDRASARIPTQTMIALLRHRDPTFRAWAVRGVAALNEPEHDLWTKLPPLATDRAPEVRLQVAIAAPKLTRTEPMTVLLDVLSASADDPLVPHVVWQNLHPMLERRAIAFVELARDRDLAKNEALVALMPRIVARLLVRRAPDPTPVASLIGLLLDGPPDQVATARRCLESVADRVESGVIQDRWLAALRDRMAPVLAKVADRDPGLRRDALLLAASWGDPAGLDLARGLFAAADVPDPSRLRAIEALLRHEPDQALALADRALGSDAFSPDFLAALLDALGRLDHPDVARVVLERYPNLPPAVRGRAIDLLAQRPPWAKALIAAVEAKTIPAAAVNVNQLRRLQASQDPAVVAKVKELWGTVREGRNEQRELVVGQMLNFLRKTPGDPFRGQQVFAKLCASVTRSMAKARMSAPTSPASAATTSSSSSPTSSTPTSSSAPATSPPPSPPKTAASSPASSPRKAPSASS